MTTFRLVLFLALLPALPAAAQTVDERHDAEAHALFSAGANAFSEGRFDEAYERFRRAHELSGRPELLYNVAAAADRGGHEREALEAYVAFLEGVPDADNRAYVEARIAVLRASLAGATTDAVPDTEGDAGTEDAVVDEVEIAPTELRAAAPDPAAAIALFSSAGVAGVAAIVTAALGFSIRSELDAACPMHVCVDPTLRARGDEMAAYGLATDVLAGASLALAVGGLLSVLLTPTSEPQVVQLGPSGVRVAF